MNNTNNNILFSNSLVIYQKKRVGGKRSENENVNMSLNGEVKTTDLRNQYRFL